VPASTRLAACPLHTRWLTLPTLVVLAVCCCRYRRAVAVIALQSAIAVRAIRRWRRKSERLIIAALSPQALPLQTCQPKSEISCGLRSLVARYLSLPPTFYFDNYTPILFAAVNFINRFDHISFASRAARLRRHSMGKSDRITSSPSCHGEQYREQDSIVAILPGWHLYR
jgi:hypothetical protein